MEEYEEKENTIALPIRREAEDPDAIIDESMKLLTHKGVGKKIMKLTEENYDRMKMLAMGVGQQCYKYVQNRWNSLTPELHKKEPHSMHNFIAMLQRAHNYMAIGINKGFHWMPLTFHHLFSFI